MVRFGEKPEANWMMEYSSTLTIRVSAPTGRRRAQQERPDRPHREREQDGEGNLGDLGAEPLCNILDDKHQRKQSKASSAQPRKLAATTCFCSLVQPDPAAIGIELPLTAGARKPTARATLSRLVSHRAQGINARKMHGPSR